MIKLVFGGMWRLVNHQMPTLNKFNEKPATTLQNTVTSLSLIFQHVSKFLKNKLCSFKPPKGRVLIINNRKIDAIHQDLTSNKILLERTTEGCCSVYWSCLAWRGDMHSRYQYLLSIINNGTMATVKTWTSQLWPCNSKQKLTNHNKSSGSVCPKTMTQQMVTRITIAIQMVRADYQVFKAASLLYMWYPKIWQVPCWLCNII